MAVRYTNKLDIPFGRQFSEFILTFPEVAPGLPQIVADYFVRMVVPHESGAIAIITENSSHELPARDDVGVMIFDIDVFRIVALKPDDPEIWSTLEELRKYKNDIFFRTLTPDFLETFK